MITGLFYHILNLIGLYGMGLLVQIAKLIG